MKGEGENRTRDVGPRDRDAKGNNEGLLRNALQVVYSFRTMGIMQANLMN